MSLDSILSATLFTWGVTALGASLIFIVPLPSDHREILNMGLGFSGGLMTAAACWSLNPVIEISTTKPISFAFGLLTAAALGAILSQFLIGHLVVAVEADERQQHRLSGRCVLLLIVGITLHNIPEGLTLGVCFGSMEKKPAATFEMAFNFAIGIGLQNFPEGLALSLSLTGFGYSKMRAFFYGQLSGMVQALAILLGASAVPLIEPVIHHLHCFTSGVIVTVVYGDFTDRHNQSAGAIIGFLINFLLKLMEF